MLKNFLKKLIKKLIRLIEKSFNIHIYRTLPHGNDVFYDINCLLPGYSPRVLFDVGANVGQSAVQYREKFPKAFIFSFEPVSETFHQLQEKLRLDSGVKCLNIALSSENGARQMHTNGTNPRNCFLDNLDFSMEETDCRVETVETQALDAFCESNGIEHIDYLKIDTEGHDLDVLNGSVRMLERLNIDFIEVEAGVSSKNLFHVPMNSLKNFLEKYNYSIFGIYEQVSEWTTKEPILRRVNIVFISKSLVDQFCEKNK